MSITIHAYTESDWASVARIHDSARLDELRLTVGVEAFLNLAATYDSEGLFDGDVWVAELDGDVAGFIAFSDDEITWTYVEPVAYRRGVGRTLLRHVLARAIAPVELTVLDGNSPARNLYESKGFVLQETRTGPLVGNESFTVTGHPDVHPCAQLIERPPARSRPSTAAPAPPPPVREDMNSLIRRAWAAAPGMHRD